MRLLKLELNQEEWPSLINTWSGKEPVECMTSVISSAECGTAGPVLATVNMDFLFIVESFGKPRKVIGLKSVTLPCRAGPAVPDFEEMISAAEVSHECISMVVPFCIIIRQ